MNIIRISLPGLITTVALSIVPSLAFGSAPEGHGQSAHHGPSLSLFWLNFLLYVGALFLLLKGRVAQFWTERRAAIASTLQKNTAALAEAEKLLRDAQAQQGTLASTIQTLQKSILQDGEREALHLVETAKAQVQRIKQQAKETAQLEEQAARLSIRRALADEVIKKAETKLRNTHSTEKDRPLRDRAVQGIDVILH